MNKFRQFTYSALLIIIGIAVIIMSVKDIKTSKKDPIDLNDSSVDWSELEVGDHVEMDVDFLMDYFTALEKDGKETNRVYAMPHIDDSGDYFTFDNFIGISVNDEDFGTFDALVDESSDWWNSDEVELNTTPVHIEGKVAKLDKEKLGFFDEYLDRLDINDSVIDSSMHEYYIVPIQNNSPVLIIVGALCLLAGVAWGGILIVKGRG